MDFTPLTITEYSQYSIYKYNDDYYKLVVFKSLPTDTDKSSKKEKNKEFDLVRFKNSIYRSKSMIFQYAMCNDWDYFVTFTINDKKFNRSDLKSFYKDFAKYISNYQRKHGKIKYVLIPELHSDKKNWHLHGLVKFENVIELQDGETITDILERVTLKPFDPTRAIYNSVATKKMATQKKQSGYLNNEDIELKYGWNTWGKIRNKESVSNYITKYITKSLNVNLNKNDTKNINKIAIGQNLYFCSQGLNLREKIKNGYIVGDNITIPYERKNENDETVTRKTFENEFVIIATLNKSEYNDMITQAREKSIEKSIQEYKPEKKKREKKMSITEVYYPLQ